MNRQRTTGRGRYRRNVMVGIVSASVLVAAACGGDDSSSGDTTAASTSGAPVTTAAPTTTGATATTAAAGPSTTSGGSPATTTAPATTIASGEKVCADDGAASTLTDKPEHVLVSVANYNSPIYTPFLTAIDKGYYADEGLDVETIVSQGSTATPALIAGDVQFSSSSASALSASIQDAPIVVVYAMSAQAVTDLWAAPDITSVEDLDGKILGVQSRGDTDEVAMRLLLEEHGVDPNSASYNALGFGAGRMAHLQNNAVSAAPLNGIDAATLSASNPGWHLLDPLDVGVLNAGLAVNSSLLKDHPDIVQAFICGTHKGMLRVTSNKDEALDTIAKWTDNQGSRDDAASQYDEIAPLLLASNGSVSVDAQEKEIAVRAELGEVSDPPTAAELFNLDISKKVADYLADWAGK